MFPVTAGLRVDLDVFGLISAGDLSGVMLALCRCIAACPELTDAVEVVICVPLGFNLKNYDMFNEELRWTPGAYSECKERWLIQQNVASDA